MICTGNVPEEEIPEKEEIPEEECKEKILRFFGI